MKYYLSNIFDEGPFFYIEPIAVHNEDDHVSLDEFCTRGPVELNPKIFEEWNIAKQVLDNIETEILEIFNNQHKK